MNILEIQNIVNQLIGFSVSLESLKSRLQKTIKLLKDEGFESLEELESNFGKLKEELKTTKEMLEAKESLIDERQAMRDVLQSILDSSNGNLKNEIEKFISVLERPDIPLDDKFAISAHM
ncbi:MAG: hypothetical protein ABSE68_01420 [Minisyncoccia bacterium]